MPRPFFHKEPIRPVDLFEDFIEQRGDLRLRQINVRFFEAIASQKKVSLTVTVSAWLTCAALCIGVGLVAWLISDAVTMYRF
jgi:hypothetical protein